MEKFKYIIAAVFALFIVQNVLAISPGGALGGGGKSAQKHPQQEGSLLKEPAQAGGPTLTDGQQMENSAQAPNIVQPQTEYKVEIGKPAKEGQSGQEYTEAEFNRVAAQHTAIRQSRKDLKKALRNYRDSIKNRTPESPADDTEMLLYIILAILLPPLAVALYMDGITTEFWICLILTVILWLPGIIYALFVILR